MSQLDNFMKKSKGDRKASADLLLRSRQKDKYFFSGQTTKSKGGTKQGFYNNFELQDQLKMCHRGKETKCEEKNLQKIYRSPSKLQNSVIFFVYYSIGTF